MPMPEITLVNFAIGIIFMFIGIAIKHFLEKGLNGFRKSDEVLPTSVPKNTNGRGTPFVTESLCGERRDNIDKQTKMISGSLTRIEGRQDAIFEEIGQTNINVSELSGIISSLKQRGK